ncbi:MAG: hypothetical protein HYY02_00845 [Chloroflexi bacterium]|nr:hypothetical protein [Chloroflexota bacterium]
MAAADRAKADGPGASAVRRSRARGKAARRGAGDFYAGVLQEAEQLALEEARDVEGLDQEIALLRVKLLTALEQHPENYPLLLRGVELLVRAVTARYRISGQGEEDLYQSTLGVLKGLGAVLLPEGTANGR